MDIGQFNLSDDNGESCFRYKDGYLHCENVKITEIQRHHWVQSEEITSPVFVYSKLQIYRNINDYVVPMQNANRNYILNYAMKANMNPSILRVMKKHGCSVTTVSGFELQLALMLGFEPENIVLNGNGKQKWEIDLAVKNGCLINIDSQFNLEQTIEVCREQDRVARVLLRVNPDIDPVSETVLISPLYQLWRY